MMSICLMMENRLRGQIYLQCALYESMVGPISPLVVSSDEDNSQGGGAPE